MRSFGSTWSAGALLSVLAATLPLASGCKKPRPAEPALQASVPSALEVEKEKSWLYTYATPEGRFTTTDRAEEIPAAARRVVRVVDPGAAGSSADGTKVQVVDLADVLARGRATARLMSREAFESAALAQLPRGVSSPWAAGGAPAAPAEAPAPGEAEPAPDPGAVAVIVYGTSWCGACRAAREYLAARKVPFVDKDIEQDPAAARELAGKAARLGVPTDRVPILDVRGRLLLGFDKDRLEALLGDPA